MASGGLLERDRELAVLRAALKRAADGAGEAVLVEGPAGIGKTALLAQIAAEAIAGGARVLQARGGEYERDFPFSVARQVFEPAISVLDPSTRERVLSGAAALAAPVLAGGEAEFGGEDRTFATLHGLFWLAANLAEQSPLLIAVDDLHWADAPSLRFLHYLVRRLEGLPIGLIGCTRPGEASPSPTLLAQLAAEPATEVVRPAPLSAAAVAKMIVDELGREPEPAFAEACLAATGGTPFLVRELLRALAEDGTLPTRSGAERIPELGPSTVAHATLLRLAHLPPAAPLLAQAVSVLGPFAERRLAAALAGVDLQEALQAEDALVAIEVLAEGEPLTFSHPIVRAAVYEDLAPGRRAAMHAHAAELLSTAAADPDAVATHLTLAAPTGSPEVVERLRGAARAALARGAPESAASYLTRALAEGVEAGPRAELLLELGSAERLTDPRGAASHLAEVIQISDDPATRARASIVLAVLLTFSGRWEESLRVVDAALADLGDEHRDLAVALRGFAAAFAAYDPVHVERYDDWRALLIDALEQNVPTAYAPAMITSLVDALRGEQSEAAAQLARRCLEHPGLLEDEREIGLIPQGFTALVCLDRLDAVEDLAAQLLASARARGSIQGFLTGLSFEAWASARRGRLIEAQAALDNVLAQIQEHGLVFIVPSALTYATDNALERPDAEAVAGLALSLELPPDFARTLSGGMALLARGQVKYASGDREGAERDLRACGEILQPLRFVNPNALAWRSALALATSDPVEARELVEADLGLARRIGQARGIGLALRRLGLIAGGSDAVDALREAVSVLESSPARLEHARALVSLGSSLRRAGARREAREHLSAGLELARECGAVRLADRAREELLASGARPRREVRRGIDALTPSEVRVAQLAARGASNPEIAQALFVTRNTVETHMRHIFQKLEISSRSELGGALAQLLSSPELS